MEIPVFLETPRLILRAWRDQDREPFAAMNVDSEVMRYFPKMCTRQESDAIIARAQSSFASEGFGLWAVELKEGGDFIGFVGLARPTWQASFCPCVEIGWRLARQYWGKGYAPEAALAAMEDGFNRIGLGEILSWTATVNSNSIRVMQKIGMQRNADDDFDHPLLPCDHVLCRHVLYRKQAA